MVAPVYYHHYKVKDVCGPPTQRCGTINICLTLFDSGTDKTHSLGNITNHCTFTFQVIFFLLHSQTFPLFFKAQQTLRT